MESLKLGYDILSVAPTEERHIEVKGTRDLSARIVLTSNELTTMRRDTQYYVYVVEDTFRTPKLSAIRGEQLLDVAYAFVTIDPKKWKPLTSEEFRT